jgi:hypothetical protein
MITDHRPWGCVTRKPNVEGLSNSWLSTARAHLNDVHMVAHYQPITAEMLGAGSLTGQRIRPLIDETIRFYGSDVPWRILAMNAEPQSYNPHDECPCNPGRHVTPCPRAWSASSGS